MTWSARPTRWENCSAASIYVQQESRLHHHHVQVARPASLRRRGPLLLDARARHRRRRRARGRCRRRARGRCRRRARRRCLRRPASLEPEVSLCAECAPPHHVSSSAPQSLPASPLSPMCAPSEMSAADTDMLSELIEESRRDEEALMLEYKQ